jgi:WD40 repeat protein
MVISSHCRPIEILTGNHQQPVFAVEMSPSGKHVFSGAGDEHLLRYESDDAQNNWKKSNEISLPSAGI